MHGLSRATEEPNHRQPTNQPEVHARTQLVKTPCLQLPARGPCSDQPSTDCLPQSTYSRSEVCAVLQTVP